MGSRLSFKEFKNSNYGNNAAIAADGGTYFWSVDQDLVYGDDIIARIFGVEEDCLSNGLPLKVFVDAMHPDDRALIQRKIAKTVKDGVRFEESYRVLGSGVEIPVHAYGHCFKSADGRRKNYAGMVFDMSAVVVDPVERAINDTLAAYNTMEKLGKDMPKYLLGMTLIELGAPDLLEQSNSLRQ